MRAAFALLSATVVAVMLMVAPADAKSYRSHRSSGHAYGFATSRCKTSSCYAKHPGGSYVHPLTSRKRR